MNQPLVLITGGAGFVGINLCRLLLARGYAVRSLDAAPFPYPERRLVDVMRGDVRDSVVVAHAMRDVTAVIHAAAAPADGPVGEIFSTDVAGTWTVLQTAVRNRVPRFVHLSSAAVYGTQAHHLMHEGDPLHGSGPNAEAKIEAEHLCESARLTGSCISILRPTSLLGPGRNGVFARLYQRASRGRSFPLLGAGRKPCQALDIEDACEAIYLCLVMRHDLVNDTFNLAARGFTSARECFQAVLDRAGQGGRVVRLPCAATHAALRLVERVSGSRRYAWLRATEGQESYVSVRHIENKLGFTPRQSSMEALLRDYDRYLRLEGGDVADEGSRLSHADWVNARL